MGRERETKIGVRYIKDIEHYKQVLTRIASAQFDVVLGTADIKDLYIENKNQSEPFLGVLDELLKRDVSVRLIHAKEPGENFRKDFDHYPTLVKKLEKRLCPRVHFKIIAIDCCVAYIGSANLTGAAMGMKGVNKRNMEAGILTDDTTLVTSALNHFNDVWEGAYCEKCGRKKFCLDRIA